MLDDDERYSRVSGHVPEELFESFEASRRRAQGNDQKFIFTVRAHDRPCRLETSFRQLL
jgi:hypothetical protein